MKKHSMKEIISTASPREQNRLKYPKDTTACEMVHLECLTKRKEANKTKLKEQCAWALSDANKALHKAELTAVNRLIKVSGRTRFVAVREMTKPEVHRRAPPNRAFCPSRAQSSPPELPSPLVGRFPQSTKRFLSLGLSVPSVLTPHPSTRCPPAGSPELGPDPRPPPPAPAPLPDRMPPHSFENAFAHSVVTSPRRSLET